MAESSAAMRAPITIKAVPGAITRDAPATADPAARYRLL
jgi:hypothetical protein